MQSSNLEKNIASKCVGKLKALGDKVRISIVELLMKNGPQYVWELNSALKVEQTLLSHHLKVLRDEGLIQGVRDGKAIRYSLCKQLKTSRSKNGVDLGCCQLVF